MFLRLKNNDVLVINNLKDFQDSVYEHLGYEAGICLEELINKEVSENNENTMYEVSELIYSTRRYLEEAKRINRGKIIETLDRVICIVDN